MHFPLLDSFVDMIHLIYEWYGSKICFHTKYNKEQFLKDIDGGRWQTRTGEFSYFKECPNIRTKIDFCTANIINIIVPITPWLLLLLKYTGRI